MDFIRRARPPRSCYTWILQSILTFKCWHFWPVYFAFSTVNLKMKHLAMFQVRDPYSLAEQPQIPYSISNTLWSRGSAPNPWWNLEKLHTWSPHLPWTQPKLSLTTDPSDPEETTSGLPRALGCSGCRDLAYTEGWDMRRGPGLSQHSRTHCQDPATSWHLQQRAGW